ncbi:hydrolase [Mycobacterium tuberculosis]|nr:hydrolase [Mycobacterium tuberculosis]
MRLTGLIDPVQHFVDLLTLQFGIDLPSGLSHGVKQWTEAAIGRVHCDKAFSAAGVPHRIECYPAAHGFAVPDNPSYDAAADERHWAAMTETFGAALN